METVLKVSVTILLELALTAVNPGEGVNRIVRYTNASLCNIPKEGICTAGNLIDISGAVVHV